MKNKPWPIEKVLLIGLGVLAVLLLAILSLQLRGIWLHYQFYTTTGGENHTVYGIWKVQEGHPLYAWPNQDFYQLTLYNFGFYHLYAALLDLIHVHGPKIMLYGRYLTVLFAAGGLFIQTRLLVFLTKDIQNRTVLSAIWLAAFCTWFNSYFPGYYPISIRPDIIAVTLAMLGLWCFLRYAATDKRRWVFAAAAVWVATWCLKQADVACVFGAGVYLVISRKWSATAILSLTFALPVAFILGFGSAEYRWNILIAPTVNSLDFISGAKDLLIGVSRSLLTWTFVVTLPIYLNRTALFGKPNKLRILFEQMRPGNSLAAIMALAVVVLAGLVPSFLALSKTGSSLNQMYEVFVAATTLSFVLALRLAACLTASAARRFSFIMAAIILSMCAYPIGQLAMNRMGPIVRATASDQARKEDFARFIKSLPTPVFINDEIYALPWNANGNHYPAIMLDPVFFTDAQKHGMISGGVEKLIANHWFATLYLEADSPLYQVALLAHYEKQPLAAEYTRCLDSLGRESRPHILLSAPKGKPPLSD